MPGWLSGRKAIPWFSRRSPRNSGCRDLLWLNGRDLRQLPLTQRKKRLERLIPASVGALNRVPCFEGEGRELFEAACRLDLEDIVAKRKADPYGIGTPWYKIKNAAYTQTEGAGNCSSDLAEVPSA
jgi:ATP-dependent DNA ligase